MGPHSVFNRWMASERQSWHSLGLKSPVHCNQYLKKGRLVCIEGSLQTRSWEKPPGEKHYMTEVVASRVTFLDSKPGQGGHSAAEEEASGDTF